MVQSRQQQVKELLNRSPEQLQFTAEVLCKMKCLGLQPSDAQQVLANGLILYNRSNRRARPCPVWELQGNTAAGVTCRIRVEQCSGKLLVVQASLPGNTEPCTCSDAPPGNNH